MKTEMNDIGGFIEYAGVEDRPGTEDLTFYDRNSPKKKRDEILDAARQLVNGDRAKDYGDALEMHQRIAKGWSEILGVEVKAHQVALCMAWLKIARLVVTEDHADSYVDLAAYAALAGEIQQRDSDYRNGVARASGRVSCGDV